MDRKDDLDIWETIASSLCIGGFYLVEAGAPSGWIRFIIQYAFDSFAAFFFIAGSRMILKSADAHFMQSLFPTVRRSILCAIVAVACLAVVGGAVSW